MVKRGQRGGMKAAEVNKGAWTAEEDQKLMNYVIAHGGNKWRTLPAEAGLNRCGRSCRLRWLNYLRPGIKRGNISIDEEDLIIRLHNLLGNRWSIIAGRIPGQTDNEIKNHWNTHLGKRSLSIDDLNNKQNRSSDNDFNVLLPAQIAPDWSTELPLSTPSEQAQGLGSSWMENPASEFDTQQFFSFLPMSDGGSEFGLDHDFGYPCDDSKSDVYRECLSYRTGTLEELEDLEQLIDFMDMSHSVHQMLEQ